MSKYIWTILALFLLAAGIALKTGALNPGIGNCTPLCPEGLSCAAVIIDCDRIIGKGLIITAGLLSSVILLSVLRGSKKRENNS
ncbi:MAG TPA: hypothetical protein VMW41_02025 [Candidatus Bathyarchaeia archaeon]|nr:hypothetical protein [Candidatus Bathyarchaeia archaeon]